MCISQKKYRIHRLQPIKFKKVNKQNAQVKMLESHLEGRRKQSQQAEREVNLECKRRGIGEEGNMIMYVCGEGITNRKKP